MAADTTSLHLRLPKSLYKRLQRAAKHNNVSLNTEIVNQLEGQSPAGVKRAMETLQPLFEKTVEKTLRATLQSFMEAAPGSDQQELPFKIWIEPTKPEQK
jgi:hypothetical protein